MHLFYLMKNNLKLIFRNKLAVVVLIVGPILTIALLSSAFKSLLSSYEAPDEFIVGYRDTDSTFSESMDPIKEAAEDAGIILKEYPDGEPEELIRNNGLSAFAVLSENKYIVYKSADHKTEGTITEFFLDRVMSEGVNSFLEMMAQGSRKAESVLPETEIEFMPAIDSTDYYGIIYIIYFSCCGMIASTGVLSNEKKNGIEKRYRVCDISSAGLYLSRLLPTVGVITACTLIATILSGFMYEIHWGVPLLSALIVILMIFAFSSFGFMLYSLFRNLAFTVIGLFITVWVSGFLGGSFETYMYSNTAESVKQLSPIYYANRSLVELSTMGHSDYAARTVIIAAVMIAVFSATAIAVDVIRKKGKA
ncbi:MAG: ABC transporter permease [Oscillospiraceae bacterium]|nr:ABC transporter permease [Oscillospiraceae bacterium]